jgi:tetratricopeptide (TPR) repeat protein
VLAGALGFYYWGLFLSPPASLETVEDQDPLRDLARQSDRLVAAGRFADALAPLEELHRKLPRNLVYVEQLGRASRTLGRLPDEAGMLEKFIALSPKPADACPRIGIVYKRMNQIPRAIDAFERCVKFEDDDPDLLFQLGLLYERNGRRKEAGALYQRGAEMDRQNPDLAIGVARTLLHQGDPQAALVRAREGLAISPDDADGLLIAGLALRDLHRFEEARGYLQRALAQRDNVEMRVALGLLAQMQNRRAEARAHYGAALKIRPGDADVQRRYRQVGGTP